MTDGSAVDFEESGLTGFRATLPFFPSSSSFLLRPEPPPAPPNKTHISLGRTPWKQVGGVPEGGSDFLFFN